MLAYFEEFVQNPCNFFRRVLCACFRSARYSLRSLVITKKSQILAQYLHMSKILCTFAAAKVKSLLLVLIMAVITLNYNQHDTASRRMLNNLLASGLFINQELLEEHRRMRDAAVYTSQRNMASFIAKYI